MCNAWNHPPGCTCGWGGEGHLGRSGGSSRFTTAAPGPVLQSQFRSALSFTNPNANCPVCGARVFFYQSPAGGRVFFDDLGPPWPKHPCTDSIKSVSSVPKPSPAVATASQPRDGRTPRWHDQGWEPFICEEALPAGLGYCMLVGRLRDVLTTLFLTTSRLPDYALIQMRSVGPTEFDVSILWAEPITGTVRSTALKAFSNASLAAEWCAKRANALSRPRLERAVVVKKDANGRIKRQQTERARKAKQASAGATQRDRGKTNELRNQEKHIEPTEQRAADMKKKPSEGRFEPQQPKVARGGQMWFAFSAARAKKGK